MKLTKISLLVIILSAVVVVFLGAAVAVYFGEGPRERDLPGERALIHEVETFDSGGIDRVSVKAASADVVVLPAGGETITVKFTGKAFGNTRHELPRIMMQQSGSTLEVWTEYPKVSLGLGSMDLHIELHIPPGSVDELNARAASGDISLEEGNFSDVYLHAASGDIEVEESRFSRVTVKTTSGEIDIEDVDADYLSVDTTSGDIMGETVRTSETEISATSGSIRIEDFTGDARAESVSGDIRIMYSAFENDVSLKTTSGDAVLLLPAGASFGLSAGTVSGDIDCDFPVTVEGAKMTRKQFEGTVGDGAHEVSVKTVSGDIRILEGRS